jgi:hypothetical protein
VESESVSVMPLVMLYKNCNTQKIFEAGFHIDTVLSAWLSVFTVLFPELCYLIIRKREKGYS